MKIYTEINYIWKDNKLIQTDSKSFDYEGEIESCHWYHSHGGGTANKVVKKVKDTVKEGPKGDIGKVVDKVYGGDTKKAVTSIQKTYRDFEGGVNYYKDKAQGKSDDDDDSNGNDNGDSSLLSGQALALTQGGGDVEARREIQSRSEMGLTQGRTSTLLTG